MNTRDDTIMSQDDTRKANDLITKALDQLNGILLGREEIHEIAFAGVLSRGHILLEGLPGLGKTALVKALGSILQLEFSRIQFTPDLMPSDILGSHILQASKDGTREMVFRPGPVFTNILLADEINRASPKTQSAMLETMQERSVTLLGTTRKLPSPFFVLASQNPIEMEGTYPLPEAQLDRFLFKLVMGNVGPEILDEIIATRRHGAPPEPTWRMSAEELASVFDAVDRVVLPRPVSRYVSRLVAATHADAPEAPQRVREYVSYGASPRAAIAIAEASRSLALIRGRPTVGFEDVNIVSPHVLNHRLILNYKARFDKVETFDVIEDLLSGVDEAGMDLPSSIELQDAG